MKNWWIVAYAVLFIVLVMGFILGLIVSGAFAIYMQGV